MPLPLFCPTQDAPTSNLSSFRKNWIGWATLILCLHVSACKSAHSYPDIQTGDQVALEIESNGAVRSFTLAELKKLLRAHEIKVDDPVYEKRKTYQGFRLQELLKLAGIPPSTTNALVFRCADGYEARMPSHAADASAFVAFRDVDADKGWEPFRHGKEQIIPAPFYLVWAKSGGNLPWPYQLTHIGIEDAALAQQGITPGNTPAEESARRGFDLFTTHCLNCHSVNLYGGALGPELNVPRNITEYREAGYLKEFISSPSSFRARAKMPDFKGQLSNQQIDHILDYLSWVKSHKALPTE